MKGIYLNTKQIAFLLFPFILLGYLYNFPKQGIALAQYVKDTFEISFNESKTYEDLVKEGFSKGYYKNIDTLKSNFERHQSSIFLQDKHHTSWMIAYFYKEMAFIKVKDNTQTKQPKGNFGKMANMQKMIDKRNEAISSNLSHISMDIENSEISYIKKIIKSRNLKPFISADQLDSLKNKLDLSRYNLQMVLWSSKEPVVIINNEIYRKNQKVDDRTIIKKIKTDKVLLKNKKEEKWLHLNN